MFLMFVSYLTYVDTKEHSVLKIKAVLLNMLPACLEVILLFLKKLQFRSLLRGSEQIQRDEGFRH